MLKPRTPAVALLALLLAGPAFAAKPRRTWVQSVGAFARQSFRAAGREFDKIMTAVHKQAVDVRDGTSNSMKQLVKAGHDGVESARTSVRVWGRRAFQRTHRTMTDVTQSVVPFGGAAEEAAPTVVAREITSPATNPLFLRRHDIVLAWKTSTGGRGIRRSTVLDDHVLFEDTAGELYSFDPSNGIAQWVYPLPKPSQFAYRYEKLKDSLFVVANDTLYQLDHRVGLPRHRVVLPFPASTAPAIGTNVFVIGSWERRVYGMDLEKRVKLWGFIPLETVESAPALAPDLVFIAETSGKLSAYSPGDRRAEWEYKADDAIRVDLVTTSAYILFPAEDLYVHCINRFGGFRSWKFPVRGFVRQPVWATDEVCYFAADNDAFYAVDLYKGSLLWRVPGGGWPIAVGNQNIYLHGANNEIWAIDRKTGKTVWTVSAEPFVHVARNTETDRIYLCSDKGDIYALYLRGDHLEVKVPGVAPGTPETPAVPDVEKPTPETPVAPAVPETPIAPKPATPKKPGLEEDW
jgi:outer membrane protein assembly factor BamB